MWVRGPIWSSSLTRCPKEPLQEGAFPLGGLVSARRRAESCTPLPLPAMLLAPVALGQLLGLRAAGGLLCCAREG